MTITDGDIQAFAAFARKETANSQANMTMGELVAKWQATREREIAQEAIRESLADIDVGRTEFFEEAQVRFRQDRRLPPRT